ncbi:MAG TPA: Zn-ribbon domain-containing protein [Methanomicrobiales archaeon]|jgi:predicted  nucleic acid-binding Zn-ribbon protein|nr:Zn-ribbon domain-containing protein [Methanomicrobiales archaeon]
MPHKCTRCGREFSDGSTEILKGCPSCGSKKFLFIREEHRHRDVLEEKTITEIAKETSEEVLEVVDAPAQTPTDPRGRVESIRILAPGSYELNLKKLAETEDMVVGLGKDAKYLVDIASMTKEEKQEGKGKKDRGKGKKKK